MVVRVDEPGEHGQLRQVDHLGARWDRQVRADRSDPSCLHQDHLAGRGGAAFGVDEAAGADRGDLGNESAEAARKYRAARSAPSWSLLRASYPPPFQRRLILQCGRAGSRDLREPRREQEVHGGERLSRTANTGSSERSMAWRKSVGSIAGVGAADPASAGPARRRLRRPRCCLRRTQRQAGREDAAERADTDRAADGAEEGNEARGDAAAALGHDVLDRQELRQRARPSPAPTTPQAALIHATPASTSVGDQQPRQPGHHQDRAEERRARGTRGAG